MRAVLDPNILISALLVRHGAPARIVRAWIEGHFELIVSPLLLAELERALDYPRLRKRIAPEDAAQLIDWLRRTAAQAADPEGPPPIACPDPGDDYLVALAATQRALLVSGDKHLLSLQEHLPVHPPADFLELLSLPD